jgi:hypothetical protein
MKPSPFPNASPQLMHSVTGCERQRISDRLLALSLGLVPSVFFFLGE